MSILAPTVAVTGPTGTAVALTGPVIASTGYTPLSIATNAGLKPHIPAAFAPAVAVSGPLTQ